MRLIVIIRRKSKASRQKVDWKIHKDLLADLEEEAETKDANLKEKILGLQTLLKRNHWDIRIVNSS